MDAGHTAVSGLTLAECKAACEDGTWLDCIAFARYNPDTDAKARGGANVPSECWWVSQASLILDNDEDGSKAVYKLTQTGSSRFLQEETSSGDADDP